MKAKIKVLMVDDEAQFRTTTEKILTRRGFSTVMAESGEDAVEKLAENPDVIVLDIRMPGMDGHQTLHEIKKQLPDIPVIILTGHGALPSAREALEQGAYDYLAKPCDIDLLAIKITEAHRYGRKGTGAQEQTVGDVMVPLEDYTTLEADHTIAEAVIALRNSFAAGISTSRIMETGHRSILVLDGNREVIGILAIIDLLNALMPDYLNTPKPSTADSVQYSPMFWSGMFTREVEQLASQKIGYFMSPAPVTLKADANLMEAAYTMIQLGQRQLAVIADSKVVGLIREQDLLFEMQKILAIQHRFIQ